MKEEIMFARILEQVLTLAKEQGNLISKEQVQEPFASLSLDETQLQLVYDYLTEHKVGIGAPVNPDDYLTEEEKDYLQNYLEAIAELPPYSEGQKEAYTISAMAGDSAAQSKLVEIYLQDVVEISKLYAGQGVFLEDLIGEGNVALATGVTMLGSLDSPMEAYGMLGRLIMNAMEEYIQENATNEKEDQKVADKVNLVMEKAKELSENLQRKVTVEELSRETKLSEKTIREAQRMSGFKIDYLEVET